MQTPPQIQRSIHQRYPHQQHHQRHPPGNTPNYNNMNHLPDPKECCNLRLRCGCTQVQLPLNHALAQLIATTPLHACCEPHWLQCSSRAQWVQLCKQQPAVLPSSTTILHANSSCCDQQSLNAAAPTQPRRFANTTLPTKPKPRHPHSQHGEWMCASNTLQLHYRYFTTRQSHHSPQQCNQLGS